MPKLHFPIRTARRSTNEASINLMKRRTWYGEGDGAGDQQNGQQGENELPTTVEGWQKKYEALQKRVVDRDTKIDHLNGVNGKLDERIKAIEKAQKEKLEKDGDYKTLADERAADIEKYKPLAERAGALEAIIRESNEARVKNVPDSMRALIPTDYPPERLQSWLNANEALLVKPPAANYDAGAGAGNTGGGKGEPKVTDEDKRQAAIAQANGHNVKPEDIAKRRADMAKAATNGNQ